MASDFAHAVAARAHRATDSLHSLVYFVPAADEPLIALGLDPGQMCYFASRSAPMGRVSASVTTATFYNFKHDLVAQHIPLAWTIAQPAAIVDARLAGADRALRTVLGDAVESAEMAELATLAREATQALSPEGRALYAGHAELPWPGEPHLVMWHAVTLLREYRGDGHVAALLAAQLSGIEAIVTHTATGRGFNEKAAKTLRGWSDAEWSAAIEGLQARGLMNADGLTAQGVALRDQVEDGTDRLDTAAWNHLGEQRTDRLIELGKNFSRLAVSNGAFPASVFAKS